MIGKCIALLAVVAQINASGCGCGPSSVVLSSSGSSQPTILATSGFSSGASRNVVANGKYPVALSNCGPMPSQQIPITTSHVTAPVQEKPTVRLPAQIPAPRTISHTCTCYKTIVRPRVHQQIITVPTVQRYVETIQKPVLENVQYEALPVNCGRGGSSGGIISVDSGSSCGSPVQTIQVSSLSAPCSQSVQIPVAQPIEVSYAQPVPVVQAVSAPLVQRIEIPQISSCDC